MKRSRQVPLVLLGALSASTLLTSCNKRRVEAVSAQRAYSNNQYIEGVGYFHAPFADFFSRPLNDYDPVRKLYYVGGQWRPKPLENYVNVAAPSPEAASLAFLLQRTEEVTRHGFGCTGRSHFIPT